MAATVVRAQTPTPTESPSPSPTPTAPASPTPTPTLPPPPVFTPPAVQTTSFHLKNGAGEIIGVALFAQDAQGVVQIRVEARALAAGEHGMHIHAVGKCEAPAFTSAGGHYNPAGKKHGLINLEGPHAGDLAALVAGADGTAHYESSTNRVTLSAGAATLADGDGSALVVHASPDDQVTDPTGNSGDRIACGVIPGFRAPAVETASAELKNPSGQLVGSAQFAQDAQGVVQIKVSVTGLPPGPHGMHIHAVGKCEPPDFTSAGGHFNPLGRKHGLNTPDGAHAGDVPGLIVKADGSAQYESSSDRVTVSAGPTSLFDADGNALVIHAAADDQLTDPTGNSGARIACGVILRPVAPPGTGGRPGDGGGAGLYVLLLLGAAALLVGTAVTAMALRRRA
ncbi:MAG: superoxide dismutase family protein [Chloroflexi bacterium]|nr:superoxide dismutase family protein [Chloroflexota bacterium]